MYITGAYHNYDVQYLFGWPFLAANETYQKLSSIRLSTEYNELDRNISNGTMQMWKDFAKFGYVYICMTSFGVSSESKLIQFRIVSSSYLQNLKVRQLPESELYAVFKGYSIWEIIFAD